jgi:thioredoxin reductase (NADPH)
MSHHQLIIIGSGPAGLTAALYASRANLKPLVLDGMQPGGQLTITTDVENYPGFADGVMGPELMDRFRAQAERFGTEFQFAEVASCDLESDPKKLHLSDGKELTADAIIIAAGATARLLGLENESKLMGYGVSACATCDGAFFRDAKVLVVGGGDTAMEEASFLTRFASEVYVAHRRDKLRASKPMQERVLNNPKVSMIWNSVVVDCVGEVAEGGLKGVILEDSLSGQRSEFACEGLFIAIGHTPNTGWVGDQLPKDPTGYLDHAPDSTKTIHDGVFACGDVSDHVYRQAVTAAGTGCMAAMDCERWLESIGRG